MPAIDRLAALAGGTRAARAEADDNAIPNRDVADSRADLDDPTYTFMSENARQRKRNMAGARCQIGMAHAAGLQSHDDLRRSR